MNHDQLINLSGTLLFIGWILYFIAGFSFAISIIGKKWSNRDSAIHTAKWGRVGVIISMIGFLFHLSFFFSRWIGQGHIPVSNMFEFMTFLSMTTIIGFIVIFALYRTTALGAFVLPLVVTLMGWASVFDRAPQPLIPALQSNWLKIHVTTAALGEGLFAVGFAAGLMYIIRTVDQHVRSRKTLFLEIFLTTLLMFIGFVIVTSISKGMDYHTSFQYMNDQGEEQVIKYTLPAIAGPHEGKQLDGKMRPFLSTPTWMKGVDSPRKLNTVLWSFLSGIVLYALLRLLLRRRLGAVMKPWVNDLKPERLDEISYRAIAIAFPIFTLGGLIFAMIWAEQAWGRFWGWDPKEIWAAITFLFYTAYLHLRLYRGWHGEKSAWLAVGGFIVIMFNLVFINLIIAGLHSYAQG